MASRRDDLIVSLADGETQPARVEALFSYDLPGDASSPHFVAYVHWFQERTAPSAAAYRVFSCSMYTLLSPTCPDSYDFVDVEALQDHVHMVKDYDVPGFYFRNDMVLRD